MLNTTMTDKYRIEDKRNLSDDERALVQWLLMNGVPGVIALLPQLDFLRVISRCSCGCPSVDFLLGQGASKVDNLPSIVADFRGKTNNGIEVGVILWIENGQLSSLEVYDYEGRSGFGLPRLDSLHLLGPEY